MSSSSPARHRGPSVSAQSIVHRPGLVDALERGAARRVTVVSAPPGSGKSYVLRAWRETTTRRVAAVPVQRQEHDAQRFWLAITGTVDAVLRPDAPDAEQVSPTPQFDGDAIVDRLVAALEEDGAPLVLVIDDLHELESPDALTQLQALLDRAPASLSIVLASRRDPRLRLHQLRLEGQLAEIRAAQLQFDVDETRALLAESGVELAADDLARLHDRTEGWAAGLRLAAIALAGHPDPSAFVAAFSGSDRTVSEYLLAEMLERQPEPVRRLLLRTSLVDGLTGALADLLVGASGSEETLRALEDANAFVISLDPQRTWFRYHHLFGDLLRLELRRTAPDDVPDLHRRASEWFADHSRPVEAIHHAQAAGDWRGAAMLLADHALGLTLDGRAAAVHELLQAFPDSSLRDDPELAVVRAADEQQRGSLADAEAYLTRAAARADAVDPRRRARFDLLLDASRFSLRRRRGDFREVAECADLIANRTVEADGDVALGADLRAVTLMNLGIAETWALDSDAARAHLEEAAEIARRSGRAYLEVGCLAHLGFTITGASMATSAELHRAAIALAERHGWGEDSVIGPALASYAGVMVFTGELDGAAALLERAQRAIRPAVEPATALLLHLVRGMLLACRDQPRDAIEEFRAGEQMQTLLVTQHGLAVQLRSFRVAMEVRAGLLDAAASAVAEIEAESAPFGESLTAVAALRLAQDRPEDALAALEPIFDGRAPVIHAFTTAQAHMLAARGAEAAGDRAASERAVESALGLAEPDRLVFPFAMAGGADLLRRHPRHSTAHATLITDIVDILDGGSAPLPTTAVAVDEPLSPAELKVLGFLPSNLSTPEIAAELFVSSNTVRTHIRHLYSKLGAHTRSEAVERARALGLLAGGSRLRRG